ncbi:MAG: YegS/Rv2252/BmrU family lipid kinase [Lachnospiraceae bacterium]|nr:YegS/Rv2252/BmrU family lipid kinase [Lachnospiraceae bacterium]
MKKLLFIINPKAGKSAIKNDLFEIIRLFNEAEYEVIVYMTKGPDDAERKVIADGANYDLIVCAGGDGTLENTVCGYMKMGENKVPIGYIPVGTTNDFARSMKISRKPVEAAKQIISGSKYYIDVGRMEDKYFIYIAAFGMFTDISYSTKQSLKKVMGHSAYMVEALKSIANFKSYKIKAEMDGIVITGDYIYAMITNSFSVAGFKLRGAKHVVLDDGKFDCLFIKMPQNVAELQKIVSCMLTNDIDDNELFFECKASKVTIECEEPIPWTIDGEFGGNREKVTIHNDEKAICLWLNQNYQTLDSSTEEIAATEDTSINDYDDDFDEVFDKGDFDEEYNAWK